MDVVISRRQDDAIVPESPSLIEIPNGESEMETPIFTLPTEITVFIFQQCESDIRPRLNLTHTCRRWRQITVNTPSLWTNICIHDYARDESPPLDNFLSILSMQLDRTANLLLDVKWIAVAGDEFYVATLQLMREKAPFSRWRSLQVSIMGRVHDEPLWSTAGEFTNLESLVISGGTDSSVGNSIDRKITSRLKVLHLKWAYVIPAEIAKCFAKSLTHISTLRLESFQFINPEPFLPANVVNLEVDSGSQHPFPHIRTYRLGAYFFTKRNSFDLRSMTTLIVNGHLQIYHDIQVCLPALRELALRGLSLEASSTFEAPALDFLHFIKIRFNYDSSLHKYTNASLLQKGYLLSPNISITTDSHLPSTALISLLSRSPKVTHATLQFDDWAGAQVVLARLLGFKTETDSYSSENEILCPRLFELRLDFGWGLSEPSGSKEWLLDASESRRTDGGMAHLFIYVCWKGEGAYVLLTGGCRVARW